MDEVIAGMLKLFERYDTHATWAFVGLLGYTSVTELQSDQELKHIPYANNAYSPFPIRPEKYGNLNGEILLANDQIKAIKNVAFQELASHTYSHFYVLEEGVTSEDFELDTDRMKRVSERFEIELKSIVFPRNQVQTEALTLLETKGFSAFRGNQENRYWTNCAYKNESLFKKIMRVLDAYIRITKTKNYALNQLASIRGLINIPANRFLRPAGSRKWLEKRKINRIKHEMHRAAKRGTVYHLWWHPHNFTHNPEVALHQLEELLAYYHVLRKRYQFENLNMNEISNRVKA